jgi:tetratricopeptide (TPR) repeat protein
MRAGIWLGTLIGVCMTTAAAADTTRRPASQVSWSVQGAKLLTQKNYLAFRVLLKKAYQSGLTYGDWYSLQGMVNTYADKAGADLIYLWNARVPQGKSNVDKTLEYADSLMVAGSFAAAFTEFQKTAEFLKKQLDHLRRARPPQWADQVRRINSVYQSVIHSMGRALYSSGRFNEALQVYRWIRPSYPQFRQVLFERMWAAFRAGRVEESLGAITSQRSAYFSRYLSPEAYLIQTYIFRKLCRNDDVDKVIAEMRGYEAALSRSEGLSEWAGNELSVRVLWELSRQSAAVPEGVPISLAEIEQEKKSLQTSLAKAYEVQRERILKDLKVAMAYAHLASLPETSSQLKPVEKLSSREQLLAQDLEIWPVDGTEEWADEIGNRFFIGDSMCNRKGEK